MRSVFLVLAVSSLGYPLESDLIWSMTLIKQSGSRQILNKFNPSLPNLDNVKREPRNSLDNASVVANTGGHQAKSFSRPKEAMRAPGDAQSSDDEFRQNRRKRNKQSGNNVRRQRRDSQRSNTTASESTATTNLTNMSSPKTMEDNK
ncbi:hypothetical protein RRG08_024061 [Elysia crispata]|uniref:Secreted protein n=1 Tax=Elysia crispata TaxID=231223 RepID=A0AAE1DJF9_9GAST|nr:hypothetical protein RRG08_024061 [Elysia crispata]